MKTRICPYCDSPMKKPHRCDMCHSFVWKPNILDIHYKQNVSNKDCAYSLDHDPLFNGKTITNKPVEKTENKVKPKVKFSGRAKGKLVVLIIVLIASLWECISENVGEFNNAIEDIVEVEAPISDAYEPTHIVLNESDLLNYTDACDLSNHMDITSETMLSYIDYYLNDHSLSFEIEHDFSGWVWQEEFYEQVNYEFCDLYLINENNDEYINVFSDAITQQIHLIDMQFMNADIAAEFLWNIANDCMGIEADLSLFSDLFTTEEGVNCAFFGQYRFEVSYDAFSENWYCVICLDQYPYNVMEESGEVKELTQEEVNAIGQSCNTHLHIAGAYGEKACELVDAFISENGITDMIFYKESNNTQTTYSQSGDYQWEEYYFEQTYHWYNDETEFSIYIASDSFSDEIHSIGAFEVDENNLSGVLRLICDILPNDIDSNLLITRVFEQLSHEDYAYIYLNDRTLSVDKYKNKYSVFLFEY